MSSKRGAHRESEEKRGGHVAMQVGHTIGDAGPQEMSKHVSCMKQVSDAKMGQNQNGTFHRRY